MVMNYKPDSFTSEFEPAQRPDPEVFNKMMSETYQKNHAMAIKNYNR